MEDKEIINRVAASSLVTFDLEQYYRPGERVEIDVKDQLFQGLILKEKDFRDFIKTHDWNQYKNKFVAVHCSTDAVIPTWAYMLVAIALEPFASEIFFGTLENLETLLYQKALSHVDWQQYRNAKVVIKGCSKINVPVSAYVEATTKLKPVVSGLMFGEPCSTVPLYKKSKV